MNEQWYEGWNGLRYAWPPPKGWYRDDDGRWWPEGYGLPKDGEASADSAPDDSPAVPNSDPLPKAPDVAADAPAVNTPGQHGEVRAQSFDAGSNPYEDEFDDDFDLSDGGYRKGSSLVKLLTGLAVLLGLLIGAYFLFKTFDKPLGSFDNAHDIGKGVAIKQPDQDSEQWLIKVVTGAAKLSDSETAELGGQSLLKATVQLKAEADGVDLSQIRLKVANGDGEFVDFDPTCMAQPGSIALVGTESAGFVCWASELSQVQKLAVSVENTEGTVYLDLK